MEEEEKREKGARLVPALPNAPAAIYCLKPSVGPRVHDADPNTPSVASPVTDFKQTIIAGYACDYGTSSPCVQLPFQRLLAQSYTVNFLWCLVIHRIVFYANTCAFFFFFY